RNSKFPWNRSGSKVKTGKQLFTRASHNFTGLVDNEVNSVRIEAFGKYVVGRCGLPGFMVIDAYMDLELDIADLFGSEPSIFCSKEFWRALCVIFAFNERGDIIALNRRIDLSFRRTSKSS
ncbi:hypothetical protein V8E53_002941, partial [Lactarius tabidus]